MSQVVNSTEFRYFLRPNPGVFDLRINRNRYGLQRKIINRATESHAKNRIVNNNKRNARYKLVKNNTIKLPDSSCLPVPACKVPLVVPSHKMWILPKPTLEIFSQKLPSNLYDISKNANFLTLNEECIFEVFNRLSLNDLCAMAEVCSELKFAAQKYFDVVYTAVNLVWLAEQDNQMFTLLQVERLLHNFGHLISTLCINTDLLMTETPEPSDNNEKLLLMVEKYCTGVVFWNTK